MNKKELLEKIRKRLQEWKRDWMEVEKSCPRFLTEKDYSLLILSSTIGGTVSIILSKIISRDIPIPLIQIFLYLVYAGSFTFLVVMVVRALLSIRRYCSISGTFISHKIKNRKR